MCRDEITFNPNREEWHTRDDGLNTFTFIEMEECYEGSF